MDKKETGKANEIATDLTSMSKDKCAVVQQKQEENLKDTEPIDLSFGKRKQNFISDDASNDEPSWSSRTVVLVSNLSCGSNEIDSVRASFKRLSKKFKQDLGSQKGNARLNNEKRTTGRRIEELASKPNFSSTLFGMNSKDGQSSSREAYPVCCGNEEREANVEETPNTMDNATADAAGPSGYVQEKGNINRFACGLCGKEFAEGWEFDAHYRTSHKGEEEFVSDIRKSPFTRKSDLDRYLRTHTGEKPYVCKVCNKGFTREGSLERHSITHPREKPYVCEVCKKGFNRQEHLKRHSITHTGEKPFVCVECNKAFTRKEHLNRHSITHTVVKSYVCNVCSKEFTRNSSLSNHSMTHTSEKPYFCDVCNKEFTQKKSLDHHYRKHTSEKPFVCKTCTRKFYDEKDFENHVRKHTEPFECPICGNIYLNISSFRKHNKENHQ